VADIGAPSPRLAGVALSLAPADVVGEDDRMQHHVHDDARGRHIAALDLLVEMLSGLDEASTPDAFYSRLCEAICELTSLERAVIFRYDGSRRRVRAVGAYGLELALLADAQVSVESAPAARRALEADRVIEVTTQLERAVSPPYAELLGDRQLVIAPMAASGRWVGVVIGDRPRGLPPLGDEERDLLWTLGKSAALAAIARIATAQAEKARQLQQRIDMARGIHDGVIQRLFGVAMVLAAKSPLPDDAQTRCGEEIQVALADLREALNRPLSRPSPPTGTTLLQELERLSAQHVDLAIVLESGGDVEIPPTLEPLTQSVLAEAINNARRHAQPSRVGVSLSQADGAFTLEIANDGVDHPPGRTGTGMGLRLAGFEALQHGGVLEYGRRGRRQWHVRLVVPDGDR